jgi:hypothetical protein
MRVRNYTFVSGRAVPLHQRDAIFPGELPLQNRLPNPG